MKDVQKEKPENPLYIQKVGVKGISYPIVVSDKLKGTQDTVASINLYVDLPRVFKGTHMSRFIEVLNEYKDHIHIKNFEHILNEIRTALEAESAHMEVEFPYFIEKRAPVTGSVGLMEYRCSLMGAVGKRREFRVMVKVPVQTLCPCSKEISDYGAHNQRGLVTVVVRYERFFWIEDLIEIIENCASSPVFPILKRPDEKFVTEYAYDHPMFVEDVVRLAAASLSTRSEFSWFSVEAENYESIHNHSAYAYIESEGNE
ncbi:MAG: GTP cyclohydrolase I FolE2 [Bacteriovoracaceae bacterium]|jgi:GTP cyclohydrolase I|nr:GTP cyclohydrolase I FolE2 [Deltaproteobacteria bacterium]MDI9544013.1 GTP cyclohydrolase FolE2 [Pseudomonadota bacterium]NLW68701.1 GTP cyclohydrolase I FolE2 [Bacteriovoracaceae bacterium]HRR20953.1 GTP cyclohydrolase FolE2 [Desulfomonilia bacterium]HOE73345.1 GTP cyclohydrolase FolE2 [Deltaproteobacteria bacterium]